MDEKQIRNKYNEMISKYILDLKEIMHRATDRNWFDKEGFIMGVSYAITKMEFALEELKKTF